MYVNIKYKYVYCIGTVSTVEHSVLARCLGGKVKVVSRLLADVDHVIFTYRVENICMCKVTALFSSFYR